MAAREITEANFEETVQQGIVLLDFWATWCAPCRLFSPIFEAASAKHPDVVFGKVNTEQQQQLAADFEIRSIPTLMAFRDGILVFAQPGMLPAAALDSLVQELKALDMVALRQKLEAALEPARAVESPTPQLER